MKRTIITIILVLTTLVCGYIIGRQDTIRSAELLEVTDTEYYITFGDEVHSYIFEEVEQ